VIERESSSRRGAEGLGELGSRSGKKVSPKREIVIDVGVLLE